MKDLSYLLKDQIEIIPIKEGRYFYDDVLVKFTVKNINRAFYWPTMRLIWIPEFWENNLELATGSVNMRGLQVWYWTRV